ncbi:MAG: hypothetical protein ABSF34_16475, partial [Verrucomicrobiota bacterium]
PILADIAQAYSVPPLAIVLAWLMRHPSKIIPIVGSARPALAASIFAGHANGGFAVQQYFADFSSYSDFAAGNLKKLHLLKVRNSEL